MRTSRSWCAPGEVRDGIRMVHLLDDPYRAVLPKGHQLAAKRVLDLADLADEPWVNNELSAGPVPRGMLDACAAAGFSPNFVVESDDYATAQGFVAAGLGVTLIPGMGLGQAPSRRSWCASVRKPEPVPRDLRGGAGDLARAARAAGRRLLDARCGTLFRKSVKENRLKWLCYRFHGNLALFAPTVH